MYINSRMTEMKNCCRCHKDKASDEFKDGHKTCTTCLAKVAGYQKNNPEKMNAKCKRHYEKERERSYVHRKEKVWCDCCRWEGRDGETI